MEEKKEITTAQLIKQANKNLALAEANPATLSGNMDFRSGIEPVVKYARKTPALTRSNIVATVNLSCELDLKHITLSLRNAEYNPKRFSAVIMRIRSPKTTALIFQSGKIVVTGAADEESSAMACRKFARIIKKLGFDVRFLDYKIQNIVATADVKFPIRLEELGHEHEAFCTYEPELFPGLIYRLREPKISLLLFVSGRVVLTGGKTREDVNRAFDYIFPVLRQFMKIGK